MTDESKYTGIAGLLPKMVVDLANKANKHENEISKIKTNLAKGNPAASLSKSKKSSAQNNQRREWAIETFMANPYWDYEKTADHVYKIATIHGHKMVNGNPYKISTIKKAIQGTRDEAARRSFEKNKK